MIISAVFAKGVDFVVEKEFLLWQIDLMWPPTQSIRAIIVVYDIRLSGKVREAQVRFKEFIYVLEAHQAKLAEAHSHYFVFLELIVEFHVCWEPC